MDFFAFRFYFSSLLCPLGLLALHRPTGHPTCGPQTGQLLGLIIAVGGPQFNPTLAIAQFKKYTDSLIKERCQSILEVGHGDGRHPSAAAGLLWSQPQPWVRLLTQSPARSLGMGTNPGWGLGAGGGGGGGGQIMCSWSPALQHRLPGAWTALLPTAP